MLSQWLNVTNMRHFAPLSSSNRLCTMPLSTVNSITKSRKWTWSNKINLFQSTVVSIFYDGIQPSTNTKSHSLWSRKISAVFWVFCSPSSTLSFPLSLSRLLAFVPLMLPRVKCGEIINFRSEKPWQALAYHADVQRNFLLKSDKPKICWTTKIAHSTFIYLIEIQRHELTEICENVSSSNGAVADIH